MNRLDSEVVIMVTGVGSNIGQGIVKALRMSGLKLRIIGTDMLPMSAGLFRCDRGYIVPPADSDAWQERIIEICRREAVDMIFAGSDAEVPLFAAFKGSIEKDTGSLVLVSSLPIVRTLDDKWETAKFLADNGLNSPKTILGNSVTVESLNAAWEFPLLIKPRKGAGSRDVFVVRQNRDLAYALSVVRDPVVQEYIPGDEFTSGVFFSRTSEVRGIITMKRELQSGTTYRAVADSFPEVEAEVKKVATVLSGHGAAGPINIQTKHVDGRTYTFEINPRFSGTTVFRAKFNFNEPEMAIRHFLFGEDLRELRPSKGIVMRYWEEVYAPLESLAQLQRDGTIEHAPSEVLRLF